MRAIAVLLVALVAATAASAAVITRTTKTPSYSLTLNVGPMETMYTQADAKKMHPKTGEVMVSGSMMGSSMAMQGESERHLELHVKSASTGAVVSNVKPKITIADTTAMSMAGTKLAVVAMQGVTKGASDFHYGNNVSLKSGDTYKVSVVVNGEKASITFKAT